MKKAADDAKRQYDDALSRIPTGWELIGMQFVNGLTSRWWATSCRPACPPAATPASCCPFSRDPGRPAAVERSR
jgi:hypothetical protein